MQKFMDHTHTDAFVDFVKMDASDAARYGMTVECPRCKGHGGWNLQLNAYPLHQYADTAYNRNRYSHFRATCSHCNGWGYISPEEKCPGHEWELVRNFGHCQHEYKCSVCGAIQHTDSSD